jgi:hypothetical protein
VAAVASVSFLLSRGVARLHRRRRSRAFRCRLGNLDLIKQPRAQAEQRLGNRVTPLCDDGGMLSGEVHMLVDRVGSVDAGCADRVALEAAVGVLRRLKSWVEGREVAFARRIAEVSSFPEKSLADASRSRRCQMVCVSGRVLTRMENTDDYDEV